jgi:hypothetical protein
LSNVAHNVTTAEEIDRRACERGLVPSALINGAALRKVDQRPPRRDDE